MESIFRRIFKSPKQASPFLLKICKGHQWDLRFMAVSDLGTILHRYVAKHGGQLSPWRRAESGWQGALRRGLLDMGWSETVTPWVWRHEGLRFTLSLDRARGEWAWTPLLKRVQHMLRESWRRACYYKWQGQSRIDSNECANIPYNEGRVKKLRYLELTSHELAVVTGAAVSPARYAVMSPTSDLGLFACPYCGQTQGATWMHCAWHCRHAPRPPSLVETRCYVAWGGPR